MAVHPEIDIDLRDLAAHTIAAERRAETPFGTYVFGSDEPAAELARHVERTVFDDEYGNSPELMANEYGPYERSSLMVCVIDHRRMVPAGMIRLVFSGPNGIKTLTDLERIWGISPWSTPVGQGRLLDPVTTCDVATLAVAPGYRKGVVSMALYQGIGTVANVAQTDWWVSVLDLRVLRLLQLRLGKPFTRFDNAEPCRYLDSPASLPVWCNIPDYRERLRRDTPVLHETIFERTGLEPAVSGPNLDRVTELALEVAMVGAADSVSHHKVDRRLATV